MHFIQNIKFHRPIKGGGSGNNLVGRFLGFTLLEALMALFLSGLLLTSAIAVIFNFNQIWAENEGEAGFSDHVVGVDVFLNSLFRNSEPLVEGEAEVEWDYPPGFESFEDPLLRLYVSDPPPFFESLSGIDYPIVAYLNPEPDIGLFLVWHQFNDEVEDKSDLNRSLISPLYESILYLYYDEEFEKWEEEFSAREETNTTGEQVYLLPGAIKIGFRKDEEQEFVILLVPKDNAGAPIP